jgi:enoyl-CoA hydratase/carnithine racemase
MSTSEEAAVQRRDAGAVRWLTLNRPRSANAIDTALAQGLADELAQAAADAAVRAVVLTGSGQRVFCAGVNIRNGEAAEQRRSNLRLCFWSVLDFPKPLVAALNGIASGGGCMLALLADQRVIAADTALVLPEIDIGIPTFPALAIISGLVGDALAADLVLTGRRFPADEAARWGLASVAPAGELVEVAQAHAEALAAKPAETYRLCKAWLNQRRRASIEQATDAGRRMEETH